MGKVYRHLYAQVHDWENLLLAWAKARKGKRGFYPAADFEMNVAENLLAIQAELAEGRYGPGPYVSFTIHEPKRRLISAAPFRDRVVHHATRKFPREQRFVLARRVQEQAFALQDAIIAAETDKRNTARHLIQADMALIGLRKSLLLCFQMDLISPGQYRHGSRMDAEVGRLVGGWKKSVGA